MPKRVSVCPTDDKKATLPTRQQHTPSLPDLSWHFPPNVVTVREDCCTLALGRLSLPEFGDGVVPGLQVAFGDEVLVVLADQQARLLEGVDQGRVGPASFQGLGDLMFQLFQRRGIEEEPIVRTGLTALMLPQPQPLLFEQGAVLGGQGEGSAELACLVLDPGKAFVPAAAFVLLATAAGAGLVAGREGVWYWQSPAGRWTRVAFPRGL